MDNLTHGLVGATLGQLGLKKKTELAMPTLIIAANLPDIDAACLLWLDGLESLGFRRGMTHGPIALLLLPAMLWALMLAFDHWQGRRGTRPAGRLPVHRGWLLTLAYIGCLSHPALDWLNNYGIRLLEPFSHRWFYGDTLFIIDPWIWMGLGLALWLSRRREKRGGAHWQRPAWGGLLSLFLYILLNGLITATAESRIGEALRAGGLRDPLVVASPPPVTFWKRDIFWRTADRYGAANFVPGIGGTIDIRGVPTGMADPRIAAWAQANPEARAFLFWARMPVAHVEDDAIVLHDQRYMAPLARGRFEVRLVPPDPATPQR